MSHELPELYKVQFEIDELPPMNSADNWGWRKKHRHKKKWYRLVAFHVKHAAGFPKNPVEFARVRIVRHSSVRPDPTNLGEGTKWILDGLGLKYGCGVLVDDSFDHIGRTVLDWEKAPPKKGKVSVEVTEVRSFDELHTTRTRGTE